MSFNHDLPRDQEHNMWDYLFLMMKIAGKSPRDYTVQELHFSTCLRQRGQEHRAFPINKALVLELGQDEEVRAWVRACTRVTGHYRRKTTSCWCRYCRCSRRRPRNNNSSSDQTSTCNGTASSPWHSSRRQRLN